MRIVFLGLPLCALVLRSDGHEVVLAGLRTGLTHGRRRLERALPRGAVVLDPHLRWQRFVARAQALAPDLVVSWFFTRRIPAELCSAARLGGVGVHPSLLPRHRGPDPFYAAILQGDELTGVTAHRIEREYDTGAILGQRRLRIESSWNAWQLAKALDRPSIALIREVVNRVAQGDPLLGEPQDEALATSAPAPSEEDRILRWTDGADRIVRQIRALAPAPGAVTSVGDTPLVVLKAEVAKSTPRALRAGEAATVDGLAVVKAADHGVALLGAETSDQRLDAAALAMLVARARGK
jgi:methionyl-tRNA formyltransferase